jgi:ribosome-associated protein
VTTNTLPPSLEWAVAAARDKQAQAITVLDLTALGAFTDAFLICSGASDRQVQAISQEIEEQLGRRGVRLAHREGRPGSEWVLLDYGDFVAHIFHERARVFYDLERLWRTARRTDFPDAAGAPQESGS